MQEVGEMDVATSSRELFFLYELAKVFASSIDLAEIAEYILDGTCAFLGAERGFLYFLDDEGRLQPYAVRGLDAEEQRLLAEVLRPAVAERRIMALERPCGPEGAAIAAPLVVRNQVQGLLGVATAYARRFTSQEEERLSTVAHLASLALENARMHDRVQRERDMLVRLIQAAQKMEAGELTAEEAAALQGVKGWDEVSHLGQAFGRMAQQVLRREENLRQQVEQLRIQIDEAKRARQVAEVTETEYFQTLRQRVAQLRGKKGE